MLKKKEDFELFFIAKKIKIPFPTSFQLNDLEKLSLNHNKLKELKYFMFFANLQILNLSQNNIKIQSLLDLPVSIQNLDISYNQINSLSFISGNMQISAFNLLINLKEINISFNNIEKIDEKIFISNILLNVNKKIFTINTIFKKEFESIT